MKRFALALLLCTTVAASAVAAENQVVTIPESATVQPIRKVEDMRKVFSQLQVPVFNAFKDRRKEKPDLNGKVVYDITIEPEGKVSDSSKVASSTLNDPALEKQLLDMIKGLNFGKALRPEKYVLQFPIDFPKDDWDKQKEKKDDKQEDKKASDQV